MAQQHGLVSPASVLCPGHPRGQPTMDNQEKMWIPKSIFARQQTLPKIPSHHEQSQSGTDFITRKLQMGFID